MEKKETRKEKEIKEIIKDLKSTDHKKRLDSAIRFSGMHESEKFHRLLIEEGIVDLLETLENEKNEEIKPFLIMGLGLSNDVRAVKPLIKILNENEHSRLIDPTIASLVYLKKFSNDYLLEILNSEDHKLRRKVIFASAPKKQSERFDYCVNLLNDKDWNVRFKAVEAIGYFGYKKGLVHLERCLADESARVRFKATEAIGLICTGKKYI